MTQTAQSHSVIRYTWQPSIRTDWEKRAYDLLLNKLGENHRRRKLVAAFLAQDPTIPGKKKDLELCTADREAFLMIAQYKTPQELQQDLAQALTAIATPILGREVTDQNRAELFTQLFCPQKRLSDGPKRQVANRCQLLDEMSGYSITREVKRARSEAARIEAASAEMRRLIGWYPTAFIFEQEAKEAATRIDGDAELDQARREILRRCYGHQDLYLQEVYAISALVNDWRN